MSNTISDNLLRLQNAKNSISTAITAKGGTVNTGDGFEEFPDDIATIPTGGGEIPKQESSKPTLSGRGVYSSSWSAKTWRGLTSFYGDRIWTDGNKVYYSNGASQYVLNKSTSIWSQKTWTGETYFSGYYIWSDGDNIYLSNGYNQKVLNKSTGTWSSKAWSGMTAGFDGNLIWTDGDNIYYSNGSSQYVLNKSTSTRSQKTWAGQAYFSGFNIWSDGDDIYYSNDSTQYVLNKQSKPTILTTSVKPKFN